MRRSEMGLWGLLLCCGSLWGPPAAAAPEAPTVQALLAEQDEALVKQLVGWSEANLRLPEDVALDAPLRETFEQMAREQVKRLPRTSAVGSSN